MSSIKITARLLILAALCAASTAQARWSVDWEISFTDSLDSMVDVFSVGAGPASSDTYSLKEDILKVYPPGWPDPGYSGLVNPYIGMSTTVDGSELIRDARAAVSATTTWIVEKKTNTNWTPAGLETISWNIPDTNSIPADLSVTIEDWGAGNGSKVAEAAIIANGAVTAGSSYQFTPSISGAGTYHYFHIVASLTVEVLQLDIAYDGAGDQISVSWYAKSTRGYNLYSSTDLTNWSAVPGQQGVIGADAIYTYTESATAVPKKFFKCEFYTP